MTFRFLATLLLAALTLAPAARVHAALATAITYQGSLHDAGVPAGGDYDLQFQLFDAPAGGSTVTGIVNVADAPVSGGVFTVELDFGNPFGSTDLWLQIGVRRGDDGGAFTVLAPRQPLTATPVALHAEGVAPGAIGGVEIDSSQVQARIATGCPAGQAMRSVGANGTPACVTIGTGTITSVRAGTGLTGGGETGEVTLRVADAGIGGTQINSAQVQRRVTGSCGAGQSVTAVAQDGSVSCGGAAGGGALPPRTIVELPAGNNALADIALLDDGTALLAIRDDTRGLLVRHCTDSTCAGGTEVTLAASVGYVHPRIVLRANGLPMVFHSDTSHRLSVIRCSTMDCSGPRTSQILDATHQAYSPAEATIPPDGLPVILYRGDDQVAIAKCVDADCTSASARVMTPIGYIYFSMAVDSGSRPVVGFNAFNSTSSVLRCSTPDCSSSTIHVVTDQVGFPTVFISPFYEHTVLMGERSQNGRYGLTSHVCANVDCSSVNSDESVPVSYAPRGGHVGYKLARKAPGGTPVIVGLSGSSLQYTRCTSADCDIPGLAWNHRFGGDEQFAALSLVFDANGNAVIATATDDTIAIVRCGTALCM